MWDKLNKMQVQNIACILIIVSAYLLSFVASFYKLPEGSDVMINKVLDITLVGVVGFLFTRNKTTV